MNNQKDIFFLFENHKKNRFIYNGIAYCTLFLPPSNDINLEKYRNKERVREF